METEGISPFPPLFVTQEQGKGEKVNGEKEVSFLLELRDFCHCKF